MIAVLKHDSEYGSKDYKDWLQSHPLIKTFEFNKIEEFLSCNCSCRIAIVNWSKFIGMDADGTRKAELIMKLQSVDQLIITAKEYFSREDKSFRKYDWSNVHYILNGKMSPGLHKAKVWDHWDWFISQSYLYRWTNLRKDTNWEQRLDGLQERPYCFDVLYGTPKIHRTFAQKWIQKHSQQNDFLESEFWEARVNTHIDNIQGPKINNPEDIVNNIFYEPETKQVGTSLYCEYMGRHMLICMVLPIRLYEQTQYSLVMESNAHLFFPTEKIAKPILAKRLFVVLSCQYFLRNLREIGFKTFDIVMNEDYDNEPDDETRWRMALESAGKLCRQDSKNVLKLIKPIVEHNQRILYELDPHVLLKVMKTIVESYIT